MFSNYYGNFGVFYDDYTQLSIAQVDEVYTIGKYFQEDISNGENVDKAKVEIKKILENLKSRSSEKKNFNVEIFNREFVKAFNEGRKDALRIF